MPLEHIVNDLFIRLAAERGLSAQHNKENDTHRPIVALGCVASFKHLWRDVVRCTVRSIHHFILGNALGEAEINELDVGVVVFFEKEEVLRLDISNTWLQNKIAAMIP